MKEHNEKAIHSAAYYIGKSSDAAAFLAEFGRLAELKMAVTLGQDVDEDEPMVYYLTHQPWDEFIQSHVSKLDAMVPMGGTHVAIREAMNKMVEACQKFVDAVHAAMDTDDCRHCTKSCALRYPSSDDTPTDHADKEDEGEPDDAARGFDPASIPSDVLQLLKHLGIDKHIGSGTCMVVMKRVKH